jgi:hypothetical protein
MSIRHQLPHTIRVIDVECTTAYKTNTPHMNIVRKAPLKQQAYHGKKRQRFN